MPVSGNYMFGCGLIDLSLTVTKPLGLTSSDLHALTQNTRSKAEIVRSFVASQLRFTKEHAAEGRLTRASWNVPPNDMLINLTAPTADNQKSSFDTPVLRPRNAKLDTGSHKSMKTIHVPRMSSENGYMFQPRHGSHQNASTAERIKKGPRRKRVRNDNSDNEHSLSLSLLYLVQRLY
jgi:hypothetical protein